MLKTIFRLFFAIFCIACNAGKTFNKAEDAQDAGRQFIRASLDGDYEKARFYLLNDSVNLLLISKWQQGFDKMDQDTRQQYREANILPINIHAINDSVTSYTLFKQFSQRHDYGSYCPSKWGMAGGSQGDPKPKTLDFNSSVLHDDAE